jgi:hypothetical protein
MCFTKRAYVWWNAERKRERRIKRPVVEFVEIVSEKEWTHTGKILN